MKRLAEKHTPPSFNYRCREVLAMLASIRTLDEPTIAKLLEEVYEQCLQVGQDLLALSVDGQPEPPEVKASDWKSRWQEQIRNVKSRVGLLELLSVLHSELSRLQIKAIADRRSQASPQPKASAEAPAPSQR